MDVEGGRVLKEGGELGGERGVVGHGGGGLMKKKKKKKKKGEGREKRGESEYYIINCGAHIFKNN